MKSYLEIENRITYFKYKREQGALYKEIICMLLDGKSIGSIDLESKSMLLHDQKNYNSNITKCEYKNITAKELNSLLTMMFVFRRESTKMFDYELSYDEIEYLLYLYNKFITNNVKEYK